MGGTNAWDENAGEREKFLGIGHKKTGDSAPVG